MKFLLRTTIIIFLLFAAIRPAYANIDMQACVDLCKDQACKDNCRNTVGNTIIPSYDQPPQVHEEILNQSNNGNDQSRSVWMQGTYNDLGNSALHSMVSSKITLPNGQTVSGATGALALGIEAMVINKPASSIDYIAYEIKNLKIPGSATPAYAAGGGLGFNSLTPVLKLWTTTRNFAYMIFAIIFIIIGIMIMTRQKIDPKTVANIQNALPKIIMALLLVTFSYAIAGFLIDLMFVLLALVVSLMSAASPEFGKSATDILSYNLFRFVTQPAFWGSVTGVAAAINSIIQSFFVGTTGLQNTASQFIGFLGSTVAALIIAIALLVALFRTWFALLGAYANIILSIIFAPLQFMMDAIPGQNQFKNWLKNMLANLLSFPLVLLMIALGSVIATNFGQGVPDSPGGAGAGFVPPLIGGNNQTAIQSIVGLGIILTIPKALDILKEILKAPTFKYGNAWNESLTVGRTATTAGIAGGYSRGRDVAFGESAAKFQADMKSYKEGTGPKPARLTRGGIGDWIRAKQK